MKTKYLVKILSGVVVGMSWTFSAAAAPDLTCRPTAHGNFSLKTQKNTVEFTVDSKTSKLKIGDPLPNAGAVSSDFLSVYELKAGPRKRPLVLVLVKENCVSSGEGPADPYQWTLVTPAQVYSGCCK